MFPVISKLLLTFLMIAPAVMQPQKPAIYKTDRFSIEYPAGWQMTDKDGILNFFPKENYVAVTLSTQSGVDLSLEETKDIILNLYKVKAKREDVKMTKKGEIVEFYYECIVEKQKWITMVVRKKSDLYLLTINTDKNKWEAIKTDLLKVIRSFKLL